MLLIIFYFIKYYNLKKGLNVKKLEAQQNHLKGKIKFIKVQAGTNHQAALD